LQTCLPCCPAVIFCYLHVNIVAQRPDRAASLSTSTAPVCNQRCGSSGVSVSPHHITDALAILHWLRIPQRVDFKIAAMAFRVLHGLTPPYLDQLVRVADLPGRRTFINVTPAGHPCIPAGIHRPSVVSGRRINSVEHSAI